MKTVDLFSGCGGLSLGFERAGFTILAALDYWEPAIDVYRANQHHPVYRHDLSNVEKSVELITQFQPEIVIGGPPCQDFSHAGKRSEGKRADLTINFAEIVCRLKPEWFVMENVARALTSAAFSETRRMFRDAGYGLNVEVLDASVCGVPQKRKRLVCIGKRGEQDQFLSNEMRKRMSRKPMTMREYFRDSLETEHYYRHPRNYSRRAIYSIDEPAATIRGVNRPIPAGYKQHPNDAASPHESRPLTTAERAQVQTFPSDYKWLGTKTAKEQMIGNAVPVKLAEFVAECIIDYASGNVCTCRAHQLRLQSIGADDSPDHRAVFEMVTT